MDDERQWRRSESRKRDLLSVLENNRMIHTQPPH